MTARLTASQRRLLERLVAGDLIRLPPWSRRIHLITTGGETGSVPTPTFRALLRHGWIERAAGSSNQVPTFRISEAARRLLEASEDGIADVPRAIADQPRQPV